MWFRSYISFNEWHWFWAFMDASTISVSICGLRLFMWKLTMLLIQFTYACLHVYQQNHTFRMHDGFNCYSNFKPFAKICLLEREAWFDNICNSPSSDLLGPLWVSNEELFLLIKKFCLHSSWGYRMEVYHCFSTLAERAFMKD